MSSLCSSSDVSESPSVVSDHEPFATFGLRVLGLAVNLWPSSDTNDFDVERLRGGSFHRVIGLTRRQPGLEDTHYIVWVPRLDSAQLDDEVAVLLSHPS